MGGSKVMDSELIGLLLASIITVGYTIWRIGAISW